MTKPQVIVVGAGLAGSLLAALLGQRSVKPWYWNHGVTRESMDPKAEDPSIWPSQRGRTALARAGLETTVVSDGMPMAARLMHDRYRNLTRQPYAKDEQQAILSVGRSRLNETLLNAAEHTSSVEFASNKR